MYMRPATRRLLQEVLSVGLEWHNGDISNESLARRLTHLNFDRRLDEHVRSEIFELSSIIEEVGPELEVDFDAERAEEAIRVLAVAAARFDHCTGNTAVDGRTGTQDRRGKA